MAMLTQTDDSSGNSSVPVRSHQADRSFSLSDATEVGKPVESYSQGGAGADTYRNFPACQPSQEHLSKPGGDDSITRTLSPIYPSEKVLTSAGELAEVRIDGDLLELGVVFDEYELIRFLGGGGMGNVWLAQDTNLNRLVALKVLHSDKSLNREVIQRFYAEAQVAALLNHPNIAQIYSFRDHREARRMFLTMEYVTGENLRDRVKTSGPLTISETVLIALQMAHALDHMAQKRVVHRDIKPSNILLTPAGEAKLIDMGLARVMLSTFEESIENEFSAPQDITASGVTLGTFDYISPEQARDPRTVDSRSDLYSLGCTIYFLLTAKPPFPQGNPLQKLLQHQSDNPLDVRHARFDVPESLSLVLNKAMQKAPEDRYAHPRELIADLETVAIEIGLPLKNDLFNVPIQEMSVWSGNSYSFRLRVIWGHMFWIVPLLLFFFSIWFFQRTWAPTPTEMTLPPAPGILPMESSPGSPLPLPFTSEPILHEKTKEN
ncbi:MAG: serine/threonine protein kinase [Thermoguttaceae bacterium]|nr:serine/threonine protein kinase [Thermoguttaceae bacterium]